MTTTEKKFTPRRRFPRIPPLFPLFLLLAVAAHGNGTTVKLQSFRRTPSNQTATIGERVTLACSVADKNGTLQWTRDGFGLGSERDLDGFDRYKVTGSDEEGDFSLTIYPVELEDDALFQCQVGPGPPGSGIPALRSPDAKLTVDVPSSPPAIIRPQLGQPLRLVEGQPIQIECVARGGKPPPEITWLLSGAPLDLPQRPPHGHAPSNRHPRHAPRASLLHVTLTRAASRRQTLQHALHADAHPLPSP